MKNNFKWHKEQINGKWYSVCDHKHVPMIEHTKDGKYKLRNANGKSVLHDDYSDAVKLALEVYETEKSCGSGAGRSKQSGVLNGHGLRFKP